MKTYLLVCMLLLCLSVFQPALGQSSGATDLATYQVGLVAEAQPGAALKYSIVVTNYGPTEVESFYILDGWTVNDEGVSGFAQPLAEPDFGDFRVVGSWRRNEDDQIVLAWLLAGRLAPGDTLQFDWQVQVDPAYKGVLINWARVATKDTPPGAWQPRAGDVPPTPPTIDAAADFNIDNNRTTDGVTVVTANPAGEGLDLALYQTGTLAEIRVSEPLISKWLVANLGPQPVQQFYVMAGWSLAPGGGSVLAAPAQEPDFGAFRVVGSWRQSSPDEERWLWLLEGSLPPGSSAAFEWVRRIIPSYQGDFINRTEVAVVGPPSGNWLPRLGTGFAPPTLSNPTDTFPANDRSVDALTTIHP